MYIETNTPLTFDLCHELTCDLNKMKGCRVGSEEGREMRRQQKGRRGRGNISNVTKFAVCSASQRRGKQNMKVR